MALIENLQRENLNAIEESLGYAQLVSQFQLTQELVATKVGNNPARNAAGKDADGRASRTRGWLTVAAYF